MNKSLSAAPLGISRSDCRRPRARLPRPSLPLAATEKIDMTKFLAAALFSIAVAAAPAAWAGEKTITLAVDGMYCAACPITVKQSLTAVPGVAKVVVSYADKTAIVTFDDGKTSVPALIAATTSAGYPSAPKG
jgi:mercuric ion binding protein